MKITKLVHSCLIVEVDGKKALIDPGVYSWDSGLIADDLLREIDYVCITHEHPDHFHLDFCKAVYEFSPNALWFSVPHVANKLVEMGIEAHETSELTDVQFIQSKHANLDPWFAQQPQHTSFVIFKDLLVSGDHQDHTEMHGATVMAGAINGGPWGAVIGAVAMIEKMKIRPKVYIPLHDWHWNEQARVGFYERAGIVMNDFNVRFIPIVNAVPIEI